MTRVSQQRSNSISLEVFFFYGRDFKRTGREKTGRMKQFCLCCETRLKYFCKELFAAWGGRARLSNAEADIAHVGSDGLRIMQVQVMIMMTLFL